MIDEKKINKDGMKAFYEALSKANDGNVKKKKVKNTSKKKK